MGQLLTPTTFEFFATYLLAGYVIIIVRSRFIIGLQPKPSELIVEAVILSLINQLIALAIAETATLFDIVNKIGLPPTSSELYFFLKILLLPSLIGLALGYNLSAGWKNAFLRRLSLPVIHPVQRAHDFAFGHNREAGFVIITYHDGTTISGYFGEDSLAATNTDRSDLFLESLYEVDEDGQWSEPIPKRSGLISLQAVRTIEFLK
jgi:hypothetical protein